MFGEAENSRMAVPKQAASLFEFLEDESEDYDDDDDDSGDDDSE